MKTCCLCGAEDNPMVDSTDTWAEITHFVRPEIRFLKPGETLTARDRRFGWQERAIFQGRRAIEREICMNCINANYIRRQLNSEQQKKARALEQSQNGEQNFYLLLADVDGAY